MAVRRKCPKCQNWNGSEDYCQFCNEVLSPLIIEEIREKEREEIRRNAPKTSLDNFIDSWEKSPSLFLRILYKVCYTVTAIVMGIAFLFAYLTVGSNG